MIDFSNITARGECCASCEKKGKGICSGCIELDGYVQEWAQSGRCKIHACTREHGVQLCGLCKEFPCERLPQIVSWNPNIIEHMSNLRNEYNKTKRKIRSSGVINNNE